MKKVMSLMNLLKDSGQGSDKGGNGSGSSDEPISDEDFQDLLIRLKMVRLSLPTKT